jgi:hypothetical protein
MKRTAATRERDTHSEAYLEKADFGTSAAVGESAGRAALPAIAFARFFRWRCPIHLSLKQGDLFP